MQPGGPILIINHTFPPYKGIGGRRWVKFAKALARQGREVHVIHSAGADELKGSLWTKDAGTPGIHTHPLPQLYPTVLFKRPLEALHEKVAYRLWSRVLPLFSRGNWMDKTVFWRGPLLAKAGALIRTHGIRDVIVTGAPFRLCSYGVDLKELHDIRLICDLRDPWTWQDTYGGHALSQRRKAYESTLEARMMAGSDRITTPHPSIIEHLAQAYPQHAHKLYLLPHAIDPDELVVSPPPGGNSGMRLIYAGSLKGGREVDRYFAAVIAAFSNLRGLSSEHFRNTTYDLHITGHDVEPYRQAVARAGLQEHIRFHAPLTPDRLAQRIVASDAVMAFLPSSTSRLLGTKFNEIFHLQRSVIHVGEPSVMSDHIVRNGLGISIALEQLSEELPRLITTGATLPTNPQHDLSGHLLEQVTARFTREVLH